MPQAQVLLQSSNQKLKKWIEIKLSDGDVTGAIQILSSDFSLAPSNIETMEALQRKHPPAPSNVHLPPPPSTSVAHMIVTSEEILKAIRSFGPGSAAGPDQLKPQHLKELTTRQTGEAGSRLVTALASLASNVRTLTSLMAPWAQNAVRRVKYTYIYILQCWASKREFYISGSTLLCQFIELVTFVRCTFIFALRNITLGGYLDTHRNI